MQQIVEHPGVDSGIDLINSGVAETFGILEGNCRDYTGHSRLYALKENVAVAYWRPGYFRGDTFLPAGWYCILTHVLLLKEKYWVQGEVVA